MGQCPRLLVLLVLLGSGRSSPEEQQKFSAELDSLLVPARECLAKVLRCSHIEPVDTNGCSTNIRAGLLERWAEVARDPGTGVCEWLKFGANAGLSADPTGTDGVFPRADDKFSASDCLYEDFVAHSKAAQDDEAKNQMRQYADQGWLEQTSHEELVRSYGADYTVSDFCVVTKEKQGKAKKRLILDLKRSGVSNRTRKTHRITLPRLSDLIQDILQLLATCSAEQKVEVFVLDFANAFWQIPLAKQERRHFIGYDGENLWMYKRSAQGSRNGPLSWAGPSSLLFRCTQSIFTGMSSQAKFPEARSQLYVDDPAIAIRGNEQQRDEFIAVAVLVWRLLGFDLSFHKAQRGTTVTWIGEAY